MKDSSAQPALHDSASPLQAHARSMPAILSFVLLAYVWAWAVGLAATQAKADWPALGAALMMLAGFGPSFAGFAVTALLSDRAGRRDWIARCLNWRVDWRWFAAAFLTPPAVMVCGLIIDVALGGSPPKFSAAHHIPLAIANFGFVLLIGGPLGEEFGWRGYLMPALTARLNWRIASLAIGVVWGLWHLPLFFLANTAQVDMPIPLFMLNILAGSVLFGWLFEQTQRSVLPALVLHTSLNAWAGILVVVPAAGAGRPYALVTWLLVLIACGLLLAPDKRHHGRDTAQ